GDTRVQHTLERAHQHLRAATGSDASDVDRLVGGVGVAGSGDAGSQGLEEIPPWNHLNIRAQAEGLRHYGLPRLANRPRRRRSRTWAAPSDPQLPASPSNCELFLRWIWFIRVHLWPFFDYFIFKRASSSTRTARDGLNTPQEQNRAR